MALIGDLIKKYEAEGQQRIAEARRMRGDSSPINSRDDIFLKVDTPPIRFLKEQDTNSSRGSIWKARPLAVDPQKGITPELQEEIRLNQATNLYPSQSNQSSGRSVHELETEVERLRTENAELRRRITESELGRV